jgi:formylmethanofuran dehydrogenase subunit E
MNVFDFMKLNNHERDYMYSKYNEYLESQKGSSYSFVRPTSFEEFMLNSFIQCDNCKAWVYVEDLQDTEGKLNGSIGKVCLQCYEDLDIGR